MNLSTKLLSLTLLFILFACGSDKGPDLIKFKSGLYGSKEGAFKIKFPDKPRTSSRHYQLGPIGEYYEHVFAYRSGVEHIYNVSYIDFPEGQLESQDTEQIFDQTIETISVEAGNFRIQSRELNNDPGFDKSITYSMFSSIPGSMMKAKLLRKGNRLYSVYFDCARRQPNTSDIDNFLNSFELYQPKDE